MPRAPRRRRSAAHSPSGSVKERPGIVDVAALAGVSHITVSRVINSHPRVSEDTRRRVSKALKTLGYRANIAARALVTGRSRTIGVICYNTTLYGTSAALLGLEQAAGESGYFVSLIGLNSLNEAAVEEAVQRLRQQSVDGIVVVSVQTAMARAARRISVEIPTVAIWGPKTKGIPNVASEEVAGARLATEHLLDLGHRNVSHLAGPVDRVSTDDRMRGWREALQGRSIRPEPPIHGDWSAASGYEQGKVLSADRSTTAIFVANDQMALGVLRAAQESGRSVPRELSVVGFDDIPDAAFFAPPLTTIRQDFTTLGRQAFELISKLIQKSAPVGSLALPVDLVVRASSARPPA